MSDTATLFVVKEDEEYCILFDPTHPVGLFEALFEQADRPELGLSQEDVLEVIEDMVPNRLRTI